MSEITGDASIVDLPIDRLLRRCPQFVRLSFAYRLACIGCSFSRFHNIHQAIELHSLTAGQAAQLKDQILADCAQPPDSDSITEGEDYVQ